MNGRARLAMFLLVLPIGCVAGAGDERDDGDVDERESEATSWACYAPKPGHPTTAEKTAWIEKARGPAQQAEAKYGVPAAAILAMTAAEAGFGWTRTALEANNPFGWKWTATSSGGRGYYTLTCQPSWDANNKYVKFAGVEDAILFVASRLATMGESWANYKAVTDRYIADRKNGVAVITAVNRWIDGIADEGYNYDPPTYKKKIKSFANNYMTASTTYSETYNLYRYSAAPAPAPSPSVWIAIDSPASNSTVWGTVNFAATVGGGTVTAVSFYSRAIGASEWYLLRSDTAAPFATSWATDPWVADGAYELKAEAWNGSIKVATGVIRVNVQN